MKEPKITRIIVDQKVADQELVQRYIKNNPQAKVVQQDITEADKEIMILVGQLAAMIIATAEKIQD